MTLVLPAALRDAIRRHGEADYPHEACGLIGGTAEAVDSVERKVGVRLVALRNGREDSLRNRYLIHPDAFREAEAELRRAGLDVVGVYHSHPDHPAAPSAYDREHAWPWLSYVIVSVAAGRAGELRSWTLAADRTAFTEEPLVNEERKVAWQSRS